MEPSCTWSSLVGAVCPKAGTVAKRRTHRAAAARNQLPAHRRQGMVASPNGKSWRIANRDRNTVLLANRYFPIVSRVVPAHSPLLHPPCPGSEQAGVGRLLFRMERSDSARTCFRHLGLRSPDQYGSSKTVFIRLDLMRLTVIRVL